MLGPLCAKEERPRLDLLKCVHAGKQTIESRLVQPFRDLLIDNLIEDPCHAIRLVRNIVSLLNPQEGLTSAFNPFPSHHPSGH